MELATASVAEKTVFEQSVTVPEIDVVEQYQKERNKPMPGKTHARIQILLGMNLEMKYGEQYSVFSEFELDLKGKKVVPDLCLYPVVQMDWEDDELRSKIPPTLAIEILSPKQALNDILKKIRDIYFPAGVPSCWLVVPSLRVITVMYPNGKTKIFNEGICKDEVLGFEVDLTTLFK